MFTTVGSPAKRRFLLDTFTGLREDHIGDSRSASFESMVANLTDSKGVHLVLNSLSDDKLKVLSHMPVDAMHACSCKACHMIKAIECPV